MRLNALTLGYLDELMRKPCTFCKPCNPLPHHPKYRIFAPVNNAKKECSYYE